MKAIYNNLYYSAVQESFLSDFELFFIKKLESHKFIKAAFYAGSSAQHELLLAKDGKYYSIVSDIEIGIVTNNLLKRRKVRHLSYLLSNYFDLDIELFMVTKRRLKYCLSHNFSFRTKWTTIHAYEIFKNKKIIFNRTKNQLHNTKNCQKIHPWEGIRIILNRFCEGAPLLIPWIRSKKILNREQLLRWITKTLNACGDNLLLLNNSFDSSYKKRFDIWQDIGKTLCQSTIEYEIISNAYKARSCGRCAELFEHREIIYSLIKHGIYSNLSKTINLKNQRNHLLEIQDGIARYKPPTIIQTGIYRIDILYDLLFRIQRIGGLHFLKTKLLCKWPKYISFQHWAYSIVINTLLQQNLKIAERVFYEQTNEFYKYSEYMPFNEIVYSWWKATCK